VARDHQRRHQRAATDAINAADGPDDETDLYGAFRRHVLSNVAEPGAIPGGTASVSITDLLGATDPTSLVKQVVATLSAITAVTPGFEVDAIYQAPAKGTDAGLTDETPSPAGDRPDPSDAPVDKAASHQVFVRIRKARTQETLQTKLIHAPTAGLAMRESGYWAAAYILSRDSTAPEWTRWSEDSAPALADHDEAGGGNFPTKGGEGFDQHMYLFSFYQARSGRDGERGGSVRL